MTRFRDVKYARIWDTDWVDDDRTQSDYKYKSELQNPERNLYLVLRLRGETEHDTNDNVTTKTQNTFKTAHMNTDTWVHSSLC